MLLSEQDTYYMRKALKEAERAYDEKEVPVGCVVVSSDRRVIARGHNQVERLNDCTAHAEVIALTAGFQTLGQKYVAGCTLYATLEPCVMCAGAIAWSRIGRLVFGCRDKEKGFLSFMDSRKLFPKTSITYPWLEDECAYLIKQFFKERRS